MRLFPDNLFVVINYDHPVSLWTTKEEANQAAGDLKVTMENYPHLNQEIEILTFVEWSDRVKVLAKAGKI